MPAPRLKGKALRLLRQLISPQPLRRLAYEQLRREYGIDKLAMLPPQARALFDERPRPIAGAPPRQWQDGQWGIPTPSGHRQSGDRLRQAYRSGETTPLAVLQNLRDRLASQDFGEAVYSPFVALDWERALEDARASGDRYRQGSPLGPLDGLPVPIKDHHDVCGMPTRSGAGLEVPIAQRDSRAVERLRAAGALIFGKTHTTERGLQPTGYNMHFSMPRNVYDRDRAAGGSSTGTAVAAALGMATVGMGSDGGGSVRIPAALNGVCGLKPSYLRISRIGDLWDNNTMGHNGPIGQTTADLADLLVAIATQPDPEDFPTTYAPVVPDLGARWQAAIGRGVKGCRIGIWRWAWQEADPAIARPGMEALQALEKEGATLTDIEIPYGEHHQAIGVLSIGVETLGSLSDVVQQFGESCSDDLRFLLQVLSSVTAGEYVRVRRNRAVLRQSLARTLAGIDAIAAPATNALAPPYPLSENGIAVTDATAIRQLCRYSFLANLTGVPAGVVPVGLAGGLPVGLQFIADAWDEASAIAVMAHCDRLQITDLPAPKAFAPLA